MSDQDQKLGWYSQQAVAAGCGTIWYSTPDGREIEVTAVGVEDMVYNWPDKKCLGPVATFTRLGQKNRFLAKWEDTRLWRRF